MQNLLQEGLIYFKEGRYFDAHESWEELWKATSPGPLRQLYQGLIQGAVGLHHYNHGNPNGARAQLTKALAKLEGRGLDAYTREACPIDTSEIAQQLRKALETLDVSSVRTPRLQ